MDIDCKYLEDMVGKRLFENMTEFRRLESEVIKPGLIKDELLLYLNKRTSKNSLIMADNNNIIADFLRPLLEKEIETSAADSLFAISQKFYTFNNNVDMGLSLEIHKGLLRWAKMRGDRNRAVKSLYCIGIIYQQLNQHLGHQNSREMFYREALGMFEEGASYREYYFEIDDKEARMYINRCIGNVYVMHGVSRRINFDTGIVLFLDSIKTAIDFWNDEKVRAHDPDFPWEMFISNAHQNICTLDDFLREQTPENFSHILAKLVCDSFDFLSNAAANINRFWPEIRTNHMRYATSYYKGEININELICKLRLMFSNVKDDDYSSEGLYGMSYLAIMLTEYLKNNNEYDLVKDEIADIVKRIVKYCQSAPSGVNRQRLNETLAISAKYIGEILDSDEYIRLLLNFTSFNNLPTYVHSVQVKEIVEIISNYFFDHAPDVFIGLCETKNTDDVIKNRNKILDRICQAALCHDIGKVSYFSMVSLSARRLYDFEFEIIKAHTQAENFIKSDGEEADHVKDAMKGHHKWYDGTKGYPDWFDSTSSKYKFVLDMISIADSIDAATDTIGRSYIHGVSLEKIIDEINEQSGTRYCPIIAKALKNPSLVKKIQNCITEGRKDTYYEAYLAISSGNMLSQQS